MTLERCVRVIYRKCRSGGWTYQVLAADTLLHLGEGWSAGKKKDAEDSFRLSARERGWVTEEMRRERMRGAA